MQVATEPRSPLQQLGLLAEANSTPLVACQTIWDAARKGGDSGRWNRRHGLRLMSCAKRTSNALCWRRGSAPGGNWSIRNGSAIEFTDGSVQHCDWKAGQYMNAGPARIPSIHRTMLGYCEELGIPLEVEINTSRSALMQSDDLNGGRAVEQRQIVYDTRGTWQNSSARQFTRAASTP